MKTLISKLLGISSAILSFYGPLLRSLAVTGAGALLPLALDIVKSLADSSKTNSKKREEAVSLLTKEASKRGIEAAESLIRFTIESAVQRIKVEG